MKINKIFVPIIALLAITLFYSFGFAENDNASTNAQINEASIPDEIKLYEKTLTKDQVINSLLRVAIPQKRLNDSIIVNKKTSDSEYQKQYPWLAPHIYPIEGIPKDLVITKRVKPIKISFGLPPKLPKEEISKKINPVAVKEQSQKIIPDQNILDGLTDFSKEISELTKLPTTILLPDKENLKNSENFGNLRIVYVEKDHFRDSLYRNPANLIEYRTGAFSRLFLDGIIRESFIKTGFKFSDHPKAKNQVHGFYLANEKNEIEMSFCFIWDGHEYEMERALIQECIVRSLGFPNLGGGGNPDSLIGPWNNFEAWNQEKHKETMKTPPNGLLDGDKYLISLLYNPSLKAGTDYIAASNIFDAE